MKKRVGQLPVSSAARPCEKKKGEEEAKSLEQDVLLSYEKASASGFTSVLDIHAHFLHQGQLPLFLSPSPLSSRTNEKGT